MQAGATPVPSRAHILLHPAFALTGLLQAIGGPLLPSLAADFHLNDNASGFLFLLYFAGTSLGAFFCRKNYARAIAAGFVLVFACCVAICLAGKAVLPFLFFPLGIGVGMPMSGVSLFVGRALPTNCAKTLSFLNLTWSAGALSAPLFASQILRHHSFRSAYLVLAALAIATAIACALFLRDTPERPREDAGTPPLANLGLIAIFAFAAFLQVGIENTSAAWFPTFVLRKANTGMAAAAALTSFYWIGFLVSRACASLLLLRVAPARVLRVTVFLALAAAILLELNVSTSLRAAAMLALGAGLAPIYPLVIAGFFARARNTADSRWVLASAGFGGSVLPWLAGILSEHTGDIRLGIATIPAAVLVMVAILPALTSTHSARET